MSQQRHKIEIVLTEPEACALAQLVKRMGWSDLRELAGNNAEAIHMQHAMVEVRHGLNEAGFAMA